MPGTIEIFVLIRPRVVFLPEWAGSLELFTVSTSFVYVLGSLRQKPRVVRYWTCTGGS